MWDKLSRKKNLIYISEYSLWFWVTPYCQALAMCYTCKCIVITLYMEQICFCSWHNPWLFINILWPLVRTSVWWVSLLLYRCCHFMLKTICQPSTTGPHIQALKFTCFILTAHILHQVRGCWKTTLRFCDCKMEL